MTQSTEPEHKSTEKVGSKEEIETKGKGKATEADEDTMDEDEEEDEEDEGDEEGADDDDDNLEGADEDEFAEIDPSNIVEQGARRSTRAKVDYASKEAASKLQEGDVHDDEDEEEEEFES